MWCLGRSSYLLSFKMSSHYSTGFGSIREYSPHLFLLILFRWMTLLSFSSHLKKKKLHCLKLNMDMNSRFPLDHSLPSLCRFSYLPKMLCSHPVVSDFWITLYFTACVLSISKSYEHRLQNVAHAWAFFCTSIHHYPSPVHHQMMLSI